MRFPIVSHRNIWYTFSGILIILSILSAGIWGFNLSLQFTGGVLVKYSFSQQVPNKEDLKNFVLKTQDEFNTGKQDAEKIHIGTPVITPSGDKMFNVRYRTPSTTQQNSYIDFESTLSKKVEASLKGKKESSQMISASVGEVLKVRALWATFLSVVAIVLYIIFAFRKLPKQYNPLVFGFNTIFALFHDIIVLTGVFVLLGAFFDVEMGPYFITALLTILGYSVNDTIIVFDRVRENIAGPMKGKSIEEVTEESLWQTMPRSIHTSSTVLITLAALLILGAEALHTFILALFIGVIIGTYSSIFLAAPLLVTFKKYLLRK